MENTQTRFLTYSELIFINGRILKNDQLLTGKQKIRDIELLQAAVQRPQASAFGEDAYPTLRDKAAALFHSVARNHPFTDGNKRTATIALLMMCHVNGQGVAWDAHDALERILATAEGRATAEALSAWLPLTPNGNATLDQDADHDMALIDHLISENQWLLDELEYR